MILNKDFSKFIFFILVLAFSCDNKDLQQPLPSTSSLKRTAPSLTPPSSLSSPKEEKESSPANLIPQDLPSLVSSDEEEFQEETLRFLVGSSFPPSSISPSSPLLSIEKITYTKNPDPPPLINETLTLLLSKNYTLSLSPSPRGGSLSLALLTSSTGETSLHEENYEDFDFLAGVSFPLEKSESQIFASFPLYHPELPFFKEGTLLIKWQTQDHEKAFLGIAPFFPNPDPSLLSLAHHTLARGGRF